MTSLADQAIQTNSRHSGSYKICQSDTKSKALASIQVLRALAAWIVVFHHYIQIFGKPNFNVSVSYVLSQYGSIGVDLFFVISGFVIYSSVSGKGVTPYQFAKQRLARIVPAYWMFTLISVIIIIFVPNILPLARYETLFAVKSLFFVPAYNPSGLGLFPLLPVGWTLNFEMAFYVVFFWSLFVPKKLLLPSIVIGVVILQSQVSKLDGGFKLYGMSVIYDFVIGIVLSVLHQRRLIQTITPAASILILSISALVISSKPGDYHDPWFWGLPCAAITACFIAQEQFLSRVSILGYLGNWSYSTYLCHPVIIFFMLFLSHKYDINKLVTFMASCALIALVSWLVYSFIEKPMVKIARLKTENTI